MSDNASFSTLFPQGGPLDSIKAYAAWVREFASLTEEDAVAIRQRLPGMRAKPHFAISLVAGYADPYLLIATLASLEAQLYPYWSAHVAISPGQEEAMRKAIARRQLGEERITLLPTGGAVESAATRGDFVALLDPGDLLAPEAFYEMAVALERHPDAILLYSDEDAVGVGGIRSSPRFKPAFSPQSLGNGETVGQLALFAPSLTSAGSSRLAWARQAVTEAGVDFPKRIVHVPAMLCQRRNPPQPRLMVGGMPPVAEEGNATDPLPLVSVLIPTRDRAELLDRCVEGLLKRTDYPSIEILVIDNNSEEPATLALFEQWRTDARIRILSFPGAFNWGAANNLAAAAANGEILLLLNNDIDVIDPNWLRHMVSLAQQVDVGVVGARLLYPDGRLQHGGILLQPEGQAIHAQRFAASNDAGYLGRFMSSHDLSAVTGACMAIRRSVFREMGGLEQEKLQVEWSDIEICLRLRSHGYRVVWTPHATLLHLESASLGDSATPERRTRFEAERGTLLGLWPEAMDDDPFLNPNIKVTETDLLLSVPRRHRPW